MTGGTAPRAPLVVILFLCFVPYIMPRHTQHIELPDSAIGSRHTLRVHTYAPVLTTATKKAYFQVSLHADELPGLK